MSCNDIIMVRLLVIRLVVLLTCAAWIYRVFTANFPVKRYVCTPELRVVGNFFNDYKYDGSYHRRIKRLIT